MLYKPTDTLHKAVCTLHEPNDTMNETPCTMHDTVYTFLLVCNYDFL